MKKIAAFFTILFLTVSAFALPGFIPFFQDESGEFVYYRDYSFNRESYVGFLTYDDATYQLRYYAPFDKEQNLPEKEVTILLSVNPASDFMDLTGERFLTEIKAGDSEIINYLHDLMYEFNARRCNTLDVTPYSTDYITTKSWWENGFASYEDFNQFGGDVKIYYDITVPLFNIKKILNNRNEVIFKVATTGRILSAEDTTFTSFRGFNGGLAEGQTITSSENKKDAKKTSQESSIKIKKNAKKTECQNGNIFFTLDENWSASAENMWWLSDRAYIAASNLPKSSMRTSIYLFYLNRRLIQSTQNTYVDFSKLEISATSSGLIKLHTVTWQPEYNTSMVSVKFISSASTEESASLDYVVFSAWENDYLSNQKYFDSLLKTVSQ